MTNTYLYTDAERNKTTNNLKELLKNNKKIWVNIHHKTKSYRWAYQLFLVHENSIIDTIHNIMFDPFIFSIYLSEWISLLDHD